MEKQKQRVYDALDKLGIKYEVVEHEPVHTMEDMDRLGLPEKGTLCKNLFLRDSKGKRHFLVTADEKTKIDLKALGETRGLIGGYCENEFPVYYANEEMARMLGYDAVEEMVEAIDGKVINTIHPDDREQVIKDIGGGVIIMSD